MKDDHIAKLILYTLTGILDCLASIYSIFPVGFIVGMLVIYFASLSNWLKTLKRCVSNGVQLHVIVRHYQILQIFSQIGCSCFSASILPALYSMAYVFSLSILSAYILSGSTMSLETHLNYIGAILIIMASTRSVIRAGGDVLWSSNETLAILCRKSKNVLYLKKSVLACREIRTYFSPTYYFERSTFGVYLESLVKNAITIVFAF